VYRPFWLHPSVHTLNIVAAWVDLLTSHRTFSRTAERLSSVLVLIYLSYIQLCRYMNGKYPYPFLRNLKHPHEFVGTLVVALLLFAGAFRVGSAINTHVRALTVAMGTGTGDTITKGARHHNAHKVVAEAAVEPSAMRRSRRRKSPSPDLVAEVVAR